MAIACNPAFAYCRNRPLRWTNYSGADTGSSPGMREERVWRSSDHPMMSIIAEQAEGLQLCIAEGLLELAPLRSWFGIRFILTLSDFWSPCRIKKGFR